MFRRSFLGAAVGAAAISLRAAPVETIRLGYDTYSLRAWKWKALEHIAYAARMKLDSIQISSLDDLESLDAAHLERVKQEASRAGITLDAGIGAICETAQQWNPKNGTPTAYLRKGIDAARRMGARSMRCYMGAFTERESKIPFAQHVENTIRALRSVRAEATDAGVMLAVENHSGDFQARELRDLIVTAGKEFVGACLDTGNPMWVVEDPLVTLEVLGPYTVTTHVRDSIVFEHPRGAAVQWVALGDGVIDFRRFVARYAELCPGSALQLENITGRPPRVLPYLEAGFWKAFPQSDAAEFARFVALAKRGHPFMGSMIIADVPGTQPEEYTGALKRQQMVDLEKGFAYAKKVLNVGVRWRS